MLRFPRSGKYLRTAVTGVVVLVTVGCTSDPAPVGGSAAAGSGITTSAVSSATVGVPVTAPQLSSATRSTGVASAPDTTSPTTRPSLTSTSVRTATPPGATGGPAGSAAPTTANSGTTAPPRRTTTGPPPPVPTADLNAAGPDNGPPCAVDPQYSDEAPTGLRPDVLAAWTAVKTYAKKQGVALCLNDGKRSTAQQLALYADYVKQFGRAAADVYVLPPSKSAHVKGYAVDVQPAAAYQWLQATRGARGWCRIYDNEPWHFEYSRGYPTAGCPARLPKPVR